MKPDLGKQVRLLILCLVIIAASSLIAYGVERDFGKVDVQLVRFADPTGVILTGKLYRPVAATPQNKLPGVLCLHGFQNDKDTQDAFAIELSRRDFVVLAIDQFGHGSSGGHMSLAPADPSNGGDAGYKYLKSLPFVDAANLGVMGHSMGAGSTIAVGKMNPDHKALNPQCGVPGSPDLHNVLLTQARYEEFAGFREGQLNPLSLTTNPARLKALGLTGTVAWDTTYGDFANGTARRVALVDTVHPGVTHNAKAVAEAVEWMRQALKQATSDAASQRLAYNQIYMWKEWMTLLALLATALSTIPLANILLARPYFAPVAQPIPTKHTNSAGSWLLLALVNALIGGVTYPFLTGIGMMLGLSIPWLRLPMGNGVMLWFLVNALVCGILFTVWYRTRAKKAGLTLADLGASGSWPIVGKTVLLGIILFGWMYILESISESALGVEFRFLWPFMRQFTPLRFGLFLMYLVPALAFFLVNGGLFLFGQASQKECASAWKAQLAWWLKNCFAALFGLLLVWGLQYVPYFLGVGPGFELIGLATFSGMWPLMLFVLIPEFLFLLFLLTWFYRRTGRIYLGALMVASLAIWFTAAGSVIF